MNENESNSSRREKRRWTQAEDSKLVECLMELIHVGGWKADSGTFKSGFSQQLEKWMNEKIPNCGLKATPHIESRIKILKKQYNAITEMMGPSCSGFGWNDELKCIEAEQHIFDEWVKSHPTAKGLRNKTFPYFEDLAIVFGRDRATGADSETPTDMANAAEMETEGDMWREYDEFYIPDPPIIEDDATASMSETPTSRIRTSGTFRGSKRLKMNAIQVVGQTVADEIRGIRSEMHSQTEQLTKIAGWNLTEEEMAERRQRVMEELGKVPLLTTSDRVDLGEILVSDMKKMNYFLLLTEDLRYNYVLRLLGRRDS